MPPKMQRAERYGQHCCATMKTAPAHVSAPGPFHPLYLSTSLPLYFYDAIFFLFCWIFSMYFLKNCFCMSFMSISRPWMYD